MQSSRLPPEIGGTGTLAPTRWTHSAECGGSGGVSGVVRGGSAGGVTWTVP